MTEGVDTHILQFYDIQKRLGKGAYGIVWKATNKRSKEVVALKKIFDAFRNQTDAQRTYREVVFLREFGDHPNVVRLQDIQRADNDRDIYLVFEFMEADLHNVIRRGNILKETHKSYVMYQLLKAMKYLHSANVIHRDMKPSNVLINQQCRVKICDFGLARSLHHVYDDPQHPAMTEYVATRWYRAPEILLASSKYTKGVDMWSIGCILGEILLSKPLFPGTSTFNQLERILQYIPMPSASDIASISSQYGPSVLERAASGQKKSFESVMPNVNGESLDLLRRLLHFNPDKRITADEGLHHSFVASFQNPKEEISKGYDVVPPLSDDTQLTVDQYRKKLYEFIQLREVSAKLPTNGSSSKLLHQAAAPSSIPPQHSTDPPVHHGTETTTDYRSEATPMKQPPTHTYYNPVERTPYSNQTLATTYDPPSHAQETTYYDPTAEQQSFKKPSAIVGNAGHVGRLANYRGAQNNPVQPRISTAKQRTAWTGSATLNPKNSVMNRGLRSSSAPTPTPPSKPAPATSLARRPSAVYNDERGSTGAQARVNQKFASTLRPTSAVDRRPQARVQSSIAQPFQYRAPASTQETQSSSQQPRRPLLANQSNRTSSMMARESLGGYNQNMGTLTQNGLRLVNGLLNNTG